MTAARDSARSGAAKCLATIAAGKSLNRQLPLYEATIDECERPLYRQFCYGVLRYFPQLSGIARQLVSKPLKDKDQDIWMLILLGGYQLMYSRIPDHAALNTTVDTTRLLNKVWAKKLVNGVLRQWQRRCDELLGQLNPAQRAAHPGWLFKALQQAWPEQADQIVDANNQQAPMCLRVNRQRVGRSDYLKQLQALQIAAQPCQFADSGIRLSSRVAVEALPGFHQGHVSVQDEAAQLAAQLLSLAPGQRVLDACAAPGGKTCHILETEPALEALIALDSDTGRLERVTENLQRLSLSATLVAADASTTDWWDGQLLDRILLDAPCSATGVIRRNPDIKLHRSAADITQLAQLQGAILDALWSTLKPGGLLLYATCSILPQENSAQIEAFCARHNDAEHLAIDAQWGLAQTYGRQLLPAISGCDGFYYARLKKSH